MFTNSTSQTCISTLTMRHIAMGSGPIHSLDDLRTPMAVVLDNLAIQMAELERYKAKFGDLPSDSEDESSIDED